MTFTNSKLRICCQQQKPENIGFDSNGQLKLFDFGLAKRLGDICITKKIGPDQYFIEEIVGTYRYMSPEVASGMAYGKPCDVYSFGLVAWEILSLEKAYATIENLDDLTSQVFNEHVRPKVSKKWPAELQFLLYKSWYKDPLYRIPFNEAAAVLSKLNNSASTKTQKAFIPWFRRSPMPKNNALWDKVIA